MKTVNVVEFACNLVSEPLEETHAETLKARLEAKGLRCCLQEVDEEDDIGREYENVPLDRVPSEHQTAVMRYRS